MRYRISHPPAPALIGAVAALLHVSAAYAFAAREAARPALREGEAVTLAAGRAVVTRLDAMPYVESEYTRRFRFDTHDNPKLLSLRKQYRLDEVVARGRDEFEKQVLLLDWVNRQFRKFGTPTSAATGALEILEANDAGHTFFCAHYADVMVSAAASLGWVCRPLALRRPDQVGEGSTEHASTEMWSNVHRKWMMFDPTFAMYAEKDGVPLNAYELRQEWFLRGGRDVDFVVGKERRRYRKSDMPIFRGRFEGFGDLTLDPSAVNVYAFIGYIPNTDLMDRGKDYGGMFITQDAIGGATKWHKRTVPADPATDAYFPINQAAVALTPQEDGNGLRLGLKTLTPNFRTYLARVDGGEWAPAADGFRWNVRPGLNRVEVKAVNQFGVEGPVSSAEVRVEAP